eukprot:COSAG06_NODE_512_length_14867_cov_28.794962_8_plen_270_part_00
MHGTRAESGLVSAPFSSPYSPSDPLLYNPPRCTSISGKTFSSASSSLSTVLPLDPSPSYTYLPLHPIHSKSHECFVTTSTILFCGEEWCNPFAPPRRRRLNCRGVQAPGHSRAAVSDEACRCSSRTARVRLAREVDDPAATEPVNSVGQATRALGGAAIVTIDLCRLCRNSYYLCCLACYRPSASSDHRQVSTPLPQGSRSGYASTRLAAGGCRHWLLCQTPRSCQCPAATTDRDGAIFTLPISPGSTLTATATVIVAYTFRAYCIMYR